MGTGDFETLKEVQNKIGWKFEIKSKCITVNKFRKVQ